MKKLIGLGVGIIGLMLSAQSASAAPVEYVKICTAFGAGFYYIPGTDTCLNADTHETKRITAGPTEIGESTLSGRVTALEGALDDVERALGAGGFTASEVAEIQSRIEAAFGTLPDFNDVAVANALSEPDLIDGERVGLKLNWGTAGGQHAIGLGATVVMVEDVFSSGHGRLAGSGAVAFSGNSVGGRAGLQLSW